MLHYNIEQLSKSVEFENAIIGALFTSTILDKQKVNILKENISSIIFRDDFNKQIINHILDLNMNIEHDLLSVEYSFTNKHGDKYGNALANLSERVRASNQSSFLSYIKAAIGEFKKDRLSKLHSDKSKAIAESDHALLMLIDEELLLLSVDADFDEDEDAESEQDLTNIFNNTLLSDYAKYKSNQAQIPLNTTLITILSVASTVACRAFKVAYSHNDFQPLSVYSLCEQPVSSSKSRIVKSIQSPIFEKVKSERKSILKKLDDIDSRLDNDEIDIKEKSNLKTQKRILTSAIESLFSFETDSTPEALEKKIKSQRGFFSIVSAEKQALNSMIGATYGDTRGKANKDALLKGFNGEYHSSSRSGRDGYQGEIVGSVTVLAQSGMIDDLLQASTNTGVFERFIVWQEPHLLGKRTHSLARKNNTELESEISNRLLELYEHSRYERDGIKIQKSYDDLTTLHISSRAWAFINARRDDLEPTLADGMENSINILRGLIGKIDIFIMKISALFHLFSDSAFSSSLISDDLVIKAYEFMLSYIQHLKSLITNSGLMALTDRQSTILSAINEKGTKAQILINNVYRRACFVSNGKMNRKTVKTEIEALIKRGFIKVLNEAESKSDIGKAILLKA